MDMSLLQHKTRSDGRQQEDRARTRELRSSLCRVSVTQSASPTWLSGFAGFRRGNRLNRHKNRRRDGGEIWLCHLADWVFWVGQRGLTGVTDEQIGEFAGQLEQAGYDAVWLGSASADLRFAEPILSATSGLAYATSILNVWTEPADQVVAGYRRLSAYSDRVLAGIGVGHRERPDYKQYAKPYSSLVAYLDALAEIPAEHVTLAALGPKMLTLAAERTAGAHPYSTTPEHTRQAREVLGAGPLLVPEQKVVLETNPTRARQIGRQALGQLPQQLPAAGLHRGGLGRGRQRPAGRRHNRLR